jgi:triosephosphate isomerase
MQTPIIIVNVKTYAEGTGKKCIHLARYMQEVSQDKQVNLSLAVQPVDIFLVASQVSFPIYSQHIDPIVFGSNTGWILPEAVQSAGASGTLVNHSEHQIPLADIKKCIRRAKDIGLETIVCAKDSNISKKVAFFHPDCIAIEPPELIGGDISVTTANPDIVADTVSKVKKIDSNIKILCGAGIKRGRDVATALELGVDGVLLASGVVKAKNIKKTLIELTQGLK